jgi:hypothetical protein
MKPDPLSKCFTDSFIPEFAIGGEINKLRLEVQQLRLELAQLRNELEVLKYQQLQQQSPVPIPPNWPPNPGFPGPVICQTSTVDNRHKDDK